MIKQGNSDTYPDIIVISNDLYQVRYNIQEVTKGDELKSKHISYNYDYIEMDEVSDSNIDLELEKNEVKEGLDKKQIKDDISIEIKIHPLKKIVRLRDQMRDYR